MKLGEFIGLEAINENLESLNFDAIGVFQGKLEKFKKIAADGEDETDLIGSFNKWAERMLLSNPINSELYSVQLYEAPKEGGKNIKGTTSFTFMLCEKVKQNLNTSSVPNNQNYISQKELNLALENQRLAFENTLLQKQLDDDLLEDDEDDQPEEIGAIGHIQNAVMAKLPDLIDMFLSGFLTQKTQSQKMNIGIGSNIDEVLAEFKTINPNIEADLFKLLTIAKEKPDTFNFLITQLRAM
jgi:regulator of replication initiation timing